MAPLPPELCLRLILDAEAVEDVELEAPVDTSGGESSPSSSIVLLTGLGLKVTVRDGFIRCWLLSATGSRGAVSDVAILRRGSREDRTVSGS